MVDTEVQDFFSPKERNQLRNGELVVLMNGISVHHSALIEFDCVVELKEKGEK